MNKVETSVTVLWNIAESEFFREEQKDLIRNKLKNRINVEGFLFLNVSETRTQLANKNKAVEKILELVDKALFIPKKRISTKPSKGQKQKRLDTKKKISEKKENRKFKY